ncbi:MAG: MerR family transcriptional regulator, partial [Eubacteriaceae bacterium]|nr:MerR family transcriptional regulator [Eubacteriaceae bacterium]
MKINEVEQAVGITKKNIRFYEDQGLISPVRDPTNSYRIYSTADVDLLLKIKLLR